MNMSKGTITQSGAIREGLRELGVDTPAAQVIEWVDSKYKLGIGKKAHAPTLVSIERGKMRGGRTKKRVMRRRNQARVGGASSTGLTAAIEFVRRVGGVQEAKRQISEIESILQLR
jgi:hypothetical protein